MILGASVRAIRPSSPLVAARRRRGRPAPGPTAARSPLMAARSACRPTVRRTRTNVPCGGHRVGEPAGPQIVHQGVEALGCLRPHVAVVDLHARCLVAVGQALRLVQGEDAVGRGPAGPHAERRLGVRPAARARRRGGRRCWCRPPPRRCPRARCGACRRRWRCPAPRPAVTPHSSAISLMASGRSQPSCSWARWHRGMSAERGSGYSATSSSARVRMSACRWLTGPPRP